VLREDDSNQVKSTILASLKNNFGSLLENEKMQYLPCIIWLYVGRLCAFPFLRRVVVILPRLIQLPNFRQ
jgi:hypothetical protein